MMLRLILIFIIAVLGIVSSSSINNTCVDLHFQDLHEELNGVFTEVMETVPIYTHAQLMFQVENSLGETSFEVALRYNKADMEHLRTRTYLTTVSDF